VQRHELGQILEDVALLPASAANGQLYEQTLQDGPEPLDDDSRYTITQAGRDALRRAEAHANLFGPWPTVAPVLAEGC
jgi:hypothetical protein